MAWRGIELACSAPNAFVSKPDTDNYRIFVIDWRQLESIVLFRLVNGLLSFMFIRMYKMTYSS